MAGFLFSLASYAIGIGSMAIFFLYIQFSVDRSPAPFSLAALARDCALFLIFPLQHSLLAREMTKHRLARRLHPLLLRPLFVGTSGIAILVILWLWQPFGPLLFSVDSWIPDAIFFASVAAIILTTTGLDHFRMFGVKQGIAHWKKQTDAPPERLSTNGFYGIVRHPLTSLLIAAIWSHSTMTAGRLLFNSLFTAYSLLGTVFEQKDLHRKFGKDYEAYRKKVPGFIPRPW